MFSELVYDDKSIEKKILERWPNAVIEDASDDIHPERFNVEIDGVTDDEFYRFALREQFAGSCFKLLLMSKHPNQSIRDMVKGWIESERAADVEVGG